MNFQCCSKCCSVVPPCQGACYLFVYQLLQKVYIYFSVYIVYQINIFKIFYILEFLTILYTSSRAALLGKCYFYLLMDLVEISILVATITIMIVANLAVAYPTSSLNG